MLKYIYALFTLSTYFIAPLSYIYFYHLKDNTTEKTNFVPVALFGIVMLVMIIVLTKILFKFKKLYYLKLFIITIEVVGVLYIGVMFFNYITFNAVDIKEFLEFCIATTVLGIIPTSLLIGRLQKEKII